MGKSIRITLDIIIGIGIGCSIGYLVNCIFVEYSLPIALALLLAFDEIQIHLLKKELKQMKGRE